MILCWLPLLSTNVKKNENILTFISKLQSFRSKRSLISRHWRVPATRPDPNFFFATRTRPELFFKISEFRVFPSRLLPSRPLQTFYNHRLILLFSSCLDTKSFVPKLKCLRCKRWIQGKSGKFDNWFIMHFDLFQSRQSNLRFIHVEAIKSINQDGDKLLSDEAHAL